MSGELIGVVVVVWLISAFVTVGSWTAYFQAQFPQYAEEMFRKDFATGCLFGLMFGPVALFVEVFTSGFFEHGLQYRRRKRKP
jgi:hypothetical protein